MKEKIGGPPDKNNAGGGQAEWAKNTRERQPKGEESLARTLRK